MKDLPFLPLAFCPLSGFSLTISLPVFHALSIFFFCVDTRVKPPFVLLKLSEDNKYGMKYHPTAQVAPQLTPHILTGGGGGKNSPSVTNSNQPSHSNFLKSITFS